MKFQNPRYINKMGDPEYMKFLPNGEDKNADYGTPRIKSPKEMIDYVHKQNAHIMISVWASFGPWTEMYQKMDSLKALLHFETWPPKAGVKPYDPYNPAARDIYWEAMKKEHLRPRHGRLVARLHRTGPYGYQRPGLQHADLFWVLSAGYTTPSL